VLNITITTRAVEITMFDIIIVTMPVCLPELKKCTVPILIALFFGCDIFSNITSFYIIILSLLSWLINCFCPRHPSQHDQWTHGWQVACMFSWHPKAAKVALTLTCSIFSYKTLICLLNNKYYLFCYEKQRTMLSH